MMKQILVSLSVFACLVCVTGEAAVKEAPAVLLIGSDTVLMIRVITAEGLNSTETHRTDGQGFIRHSAAGMVRLLNLTADQASDLIARAISAKGKPALFVQITILERSSFRVGGEVKKPGQFDLNGKVTLQQAIEMAGGFKPSAKRDLIRVIRKGTTMKHVKSDRIGTFLVRGDDEIVVLK